MEKRGGDVDKEELFMRFGVEHVKLMVSKVSTLEKQETVVMNADPNTCKSFCLKMWKQGRKA